MARNRPLTARIAASAPASSWAASAGHNILSDSGAVPVGSVTTRRLADRIGERNHRYEGDQSQPKDRGNETLGTASLLGGEQLGHRGEPDGVGEHERNPIQAVCGKERSVSVDFPKKFAISSASTPPSTVAPA